MHCAWRYGSTLQVTPHFHSLVPDGVFVPREGGVRFEELAPPTQGEVERLLRVVRHRVLRLLEKRGALPAQGPEDALQAYQAHSLQQRLRWTEVDVRPPPRKQPRCAFLEGFSLHANTHGGPRSPVLPSPPAPAEGRGVEGVVGVGIQFDIDWSRGPRM